MSGEQIESPTASDSHRAVPAPFLTKTYKLVEDPETDEVVSWGEDNCTFVVWRPMEFARDLLPNYFKHNNFSSFVRQLNTYGFRKVVPDRWEFANEFFRRGESHLLCEIHRRKTVNTNFRQAEHGGRGEIPRSMSPSCSADEAASPMPSPAASPRSHVELEASVRERTVSVCDENHRLRRDNALLAAEVSRLRHAYDEALLTLQRQLQHERCHPFSPHEIAEGRSQVQASNPSTVSVREIPSLGCKPMMETRFNPFPLPHVKAPQVRSPFAWSPSGGAFTSFQPSSAARRATVGAAPVATLPAVDGKVCQLIAFPSDGSPPLMTVNNREVLQRPAMPSVRSSFPCSAEALPSQTPATKDSAEEGGIPPQKGFRLFGVPVQEKGGGGHEGEPPAKRNCQQGIMERQCYMESSMPLPREVRAGGARDSCRF